MNSNRSILVVVCCALIVTLSMGVRQSFGIFLQPITDSLDLGRESFSLAIAIQNLFLGLPLVGILADRIGAKWILLSGGVIYAIGMAALPSVAGSGALYSALGICIGLALGATTYVVILGAVADAVEPQQQSTAFGITTAMGSFGMFIFVPITQGLLNAFEWQSACYLMAAMVLMISAIALWLPRPQRAGAASVRQDASPGLSLMGALTHAVRQPAYWLLNAGFFVCGFHVTFIATHLPAFLNDYQLTPMTSAVALALIGLSNIAGSFVFGWLGDRVRKKLLLSSLYFTRAVVIGLFLLAPISSASAWIFGAAIGFIWLATVPLTSGLVAQLFGTNYLSTLYGVVFMSHQLGSFLGVWWGGRVYDHSGSYQLVWILAIALGVVSGILHLLIQDRPRSQEFVGSRDAAPAVTPEYRST